MDKQQGQKTVHWLNLRYTEQQCPGMNEILGMAPKEQQSALVRGILYQWCLEHQEKGTLTQAIITTLNGAGVKGQRGLRRSTRKQADKPTRSKEQRPMAIGQTPTQSPTTEPAVTETVQVKQPQPSQHLEQAQEQQAQPSIESTAADSLFDIFNT